MIFIYSLLFHFNVCFTAYSYISNSNFPIKHSKLILSIDFLTNYSYYIPFKQISSNNQSVSDFISSSIDYDSSYNTTEKLSEVISAMLSIKI